MEQTAQRVWSEFPRCNNYERLHQCQNRLNSTLLTKHLDLGIVKVSDSLSAGTLFKARLKWVVDFETIFLFHFQNEGNAQ